jgi:hypothetical protein
MNDNEVKEKLVGKVSVTKQMVTYAKSFFLENFQKDTRALLNALFENVETKMPTQIVIHPSVNTEEMITEAAKSLSWRLAGCEAIWSLIGSHFIPGSDSSFAESTSISWTTVVPGSGGTSSGWTLDQFYVPVPSSLILKPSGLNPSDQPLSDPDLYMHELGIEGLNVDIEASLRESVHCFRHELFLGCLALLGRASEGAWIELGKNLSDIIPEGAPINGEKLKESMEDQFLGIGKKINAVLKAYERRDVFHEVYKDSGYKPVELKSCVVWSDAVRESRNSIHYGAEPAMSNSYEKVAALLIGAVPNLKVIYSIINKCNEIKA